MQTIKAVNKHEKRKILKFALFILLIVISIFVLFNSILGQLVFKSTISSYGVVKVFGLEAYQDENAQTPVSSLTWGDIEPGLTKDVTIYLRNEGNYALTLDLGAENWNPGSASEYFSLSWDLADQVIDSGDIVETKLMLEVTPQIQDIKNFSFDIVISSND